MMAMRWLQLKRAKSKGSESPVKPPTTTRAMDAQKLRRLVPTYNFFKYFYCYRLSKPDLFLESCEERDTLTMSYFHLPDLSPLRVHPLI